MIDFGFAIPVFNMCFEVKRRQVFGRNPVRRECLRASDTHTVCGWKGTASYYDVVVDGKINKDAAWYYPDPKPAAAEIKDRVAFWKGVKVER